jgi:hypothetical protein
MNRVANTLMKQIPPSLPKQFSMPEVPTTTQAEQPVRFTRQQQADAAASDWNAVHATVGSFADGHSTV